MAQKKQVIERLNAQKAATETELKAAQELLSMKSDMQQKGSVARKDVLDSQRDVARMQGALNDLNAQIIEAQQAITEYENRLQTLKIKTRDDALQTLEEVETQIAENREVLNKLEGRVDRMTVRAPVRGLVKGLKVNTIGGVIGAGEPIMEIVPLDRTLLVEASIPPREIGTLKTGQKARVKVSAYDFSRYGIIEGTLTFISATTFVDDQKTSFYKGRIVLDKNYVGDHPDKNLILPGMTVEADIITGQKTILEYLLKPIRTSVDTAFRER